MSSSKQSYRSVLGIVAGFPNNPYPFRSKEREGARVKIQTTNPAQAIVTIVVWPEKWGLVSEQVVPGALVWANGRTEVETDRSGKQHLVIHGDVIGVLAPAGFVPSGEPETEEAFHISADPVDEIPF